MKDQLLRGSLRGSLAVICYPALFVCLWIIGEPPSPVEARPAVTLRIDSTEQPRSSEVGSSAIRQKVLKNRLLFPDGKVLVVLPKGLRAFTLADFDRHYGAGVKPEYAFMDDSTDSRFSVSVTKTDLAASDVETHRKKMEADLARSVQGLIWYKREMLQLGDRQWAHLEMQNPVMQNPLSDGATVMTDLYATSMGGHPLIFTVTTDTKNWYEMRKVMQKMMLSVTIQERIMGDPGS